MNKNKMLNCYYQNSRGLRTKLQEFYEAVLLTNYDIIFITETWLIEDIFDCQLFDNRYKVFRYDRNMNMASRGGGVLIAVKSQFECTVLDLHTDVECIWISIDLGHENLIIGNVYLQPKMGILQFSDYFNIVEELLVTFTGSIMMVGDFNVPKFVDNKYAHRDSKSLRLLSAVNMLNLTQSNDICNNYGTT